MRNRQLSTRPIYSRHRQLNHGPTVPSVIGHDGVTTTTVMMTMVIMIMVMIMVSEFDNGDDNGE